ncbi:hypothetical protein BMETH_995_0 [methanotrophic bacterial endosymbiont of Bathymodiolus sp.]|nr:hypothetical protein BMETH_995_0 [methanotrophic bacterial endosymbiont of Bathymodiolus sp.]
MSIFARVLVLKTPCALCSFVMPTTTISLSENSVFIA